MGSATAACLMAQPQTSQQDAPPDRWPLFSWSLGAHPVSAHSIPSDWYRASLETGQIRQISRLGDMGMYATFSPDGQWLAIASQKGILVMKPDGSQVTQVASTPAYGSVNWIR